MIIASLISMIIGLLIVIVGVSVECNELSRANAQLEESLRMMRADRLRHLRDLRAEMIANDSDDTRSVVVER